MPLKKTVNESDVRDSKIPLLQSQFNHLRPQRQQERHKRSENNASTRAFDILIHLAKQQLRREEFFFFIFCRELQDHANLIEAVQMRKVRPKKPFFYNRIEKRFE